jgi:hypothetical protein
MLLGFRKLNLVLRKILYNVLVRILNLAQLIKYIFHGSIILNFKVIMGLELLNELVLVLDDGLDAQTAD